MAKKAKQPTVTLASIVENVTEQITHKDTATMPKAKANKSTSVVTVQEDTTPIVDTVTVQETSNPANGRKQKHSGILQSLQAFMVNPSEVQTMEGINPRENFDLEPLKAYITTNGVNGLPPVKVMLKTINGIDTLVLTEGHRRLLAAKELQAEGVPLKGIPAMWCDKKETSNDRLLYANLTSNEGKPLDAMEVAKGIDALVKKFGWTQKSIAEKLHKTDSWVTQALSMLEATPEVKKAFQEGAIKATTVQSIVHTAKKNGGEDPANKAKVQNTVLAKELTKKEEAQANKGNGKGQGRRGRPSGSASLPKIPTMPSTNNVAKPSTNPVSDSNTAKPNNSGFAEKHMTEQDPVYKSLLPKYESEITRLLNAMSLELFLKMVYKNKDGKNSAVFVDVLLQNMPVQALLVTIMNNQKSEGNEENAKLLHKCHTAIGVAEKLAKNS